MLANLVKRYAEARQFTEHLCEPLAVEDFVVQSMPDTSPTRWHLAHTTWFFETFVLARWETDYRSFSTDYQFLFNSYYNSVALHMLKDGTRALHKKSYVSERHGASRR